MGDPTEFAAGRGSSAGAGFGLAAAVEPGGSCGASHLITTDLHGSHPQPFITGLPNGRVTSRDMSNEFRDGDTAHQTGRWWVAAHDEAASP